MDRGTARDEISLAGDMDRKCKLTQEEESQNFKTINIMNNNNHLDYRSESEASGRISGASQSSAFSSMNTDNQMCHEHELPVDSVQVTRTQEAYNMVELLRKKFLESLKDSSQDKGMFESSDIDEMRRSLPALENSEQSPAYRWISRYVESKKLTTANLSDDKLEKELDSVVDSLREFLKYRNQNQLHRISSDQFSKEFYIMNGIFTFGLDKQGLPILYIRARVHRKWSARFDECFRRYVAWHIDQITKSNQGAEVSKSTGYNKAVKDGSFGICFDCLNVSYACLDMDFLRFLVGMLMNFYPSYCRYALCIDLPWLFRSVWKLVKTWLPEEAQNAVHLITAKEMVEFIDISQIPNSFKVDDRKASDKPASCKHPMPKSFSSLRDIEALGKELELSSKEIKDFKAHAEKVRKEFEQLGAL